jgi:hypothetical protein
MPKSRPPYDVELRRRVVELARSGRPIESLSREFGPIALTKAKTERPAHICAKYHMNIGIQLIHFGSRQPVRATSDWQRTGHIFHQTCPLSRGCVPSYLR